MNVNLENRLGNDVRILDICGPPILRSRGTQGLSFELLFIAAAYLWAATACKIGRYIHGFCLLSHGKNAWFAGFTGPPSPVFRHVRGHRDARSI